MNKQNTKTLHALLGELDLPCTAMDCTVNHLTLDSRDIKGGELFIALVGVHGDGRRFINSALDNGAVAVLAEKGDEKGELAEELNHLQTDERIVWVDNLRAQLGALASFFYDHPSHYVKVMGVTGTNGKTSCCWFLAQLMQSVGQTCGVIGTVGYGLPGQLTESKNTTVDVITLHRLLAQLREQGASHVAIEVSSHGLDQGRVDGVRFETVLFTQISRDHLDYHGSMGAYAQAKAKLFSKCDYQQAVIGSDDPYFELMRDACQLGKPVVRWSLSDATAEVHLQKITTHTDGFEATLITPWGEGQMVSPLPGRFNLANVLSVLAVLGVQGYPVIELLNAVASMQAPPGRMQRFGGNGQPLVIVDYAHTPDALSSVLSSLREHRDAGGELGQIIALFGCGGDRDRGKRPLMTEEALAGADVVVLTSDNPRSENPIQILDDAVAQVPARQLSRIALIEDRATAIAQTVQRAQPQDIVLVAGKGHETYQEIQGVRHHFDDAQQVTAALAGYSNGGQQ